MGWWVVVTRRLLHRGISNSQPCALPSEYDSYSYNTVYIACGKLTNAQRKLRTILIKYKDALKETTNEIRESKRNFERKLAANIKQDSKTFFAYIRSKQKVKDVVGPLKDSDGLVITKGK